MENKRYFLKIIYLQSDDFRKLLIDLENKNFSNVFDNLKKNQLSQDTNIPIQYSNLLDFVNFDFLNSMKMRVCRTI